MKSLCKLYNGIGFYIIKVKSAICWACAVNGIGFYIIKVKSVRIRFKTYKVEAYCSQ